MLKNNDMMTTKMVIDEIFEGLIEYSTLLQYVRAGVIPAKKIGRKYLYSRKAMLEWRDRNFSCAAQVKMA